MDRRPLDTAPQAQGIHWGEGGGTLRWTYHIPSSGRCAEPTISLHRSLRSLRGLASLGRRTIPLHRSRCQHWSSIPTHSEFAALLTSAWKARHRLISTRHGHCFELAKNSWAVLILTNPFKNQWKNENVSFCNLSSNVVIHFRCLSYISDNDFSHFSWNTSLHPLSDCSLVEIHDIPPRREGTPRGDVRSSRGDRPKITTSSPQLRMPFAREHPASSPEGWQISFLSTLFFHSRDSLC